MSEHSIVFRFAHNVILSSGLRRSAVAFFSGLFGSTMLAPVSLYPAIVVTMTIAVWLIDGCVNSRGSGLRSTTRVLFDVAISGWWLGFGYFLGGLWWLGAAFLVEADRFAWALPIGVIGLPACLALFTALGFVISWLMWSSRSSRIFALAVGLGVSEWIRSTVFTGFPWNNYGMALGGNVYLAQLAAFVGLHGLTFLTIVLASAPATLIDVHGQNQKIEVTKSILNTRPTTLAALTLILVAIFGLVRINTSEVKAAKGIQLRLMQPNVPQDEKFRSDRGMEILEHYLKVSDRFTSPQSAGVASATYLFWPESPFPFILSHNSEALARIGKFLPDGTVLVTGAARTDLAQARAGGGKRQAERFYNSIQVIESGGIISQSYDKMRLVPFGEYLPFEQVLRALGIHQFVHIPGGFASGRGPQILRLPRIGVVSPLICYEAIFPGIVSAGSNVSNDPVRLIVNVTNDGWFGSTAGPYQHLKQARLRSIEAGIPMVRVANTGISAIVDPIGRIIKSLPLGTVGVIDTHLPVPLPTTLYSRFPIAAPGALAFLFAIFALLLLRRKA